MKRRNGGGRHDLAHVNAPIAGFPALPSSPNNRRGSILQVAVPDAYEPGRRMRVLARADLLDRERRSGKINEGQFLIGRQIEDAFEDMNRITGGGQWFEGDRIDAATSAEARSLRGLERAFVVNSFLKWLVRHVGDQDTRLLYSMLGCRLSFAEAAALFGRSGVRGLRYTIDRFRDALEVLATAKAARGAALRSDEKRRVAER